VVFTKGKVKRIHVTISEETKVMLDSVRHVGQSYSGLFQELVTFYKEQTGRKVKSGG